MTPIEDSCAALTPVTSSRWLLYGTTSSRSEFLGLFAAEGGGDFAIDFNWQSLRRHLQDTLRYHPRLRRQRADRRLTGRYGLTMRELAVMRLIASGADNHTVADELSIGLATVKTHVFNIFNKMGVDCRSAAVAIAFRLETEEEEEETLPRLIVIAELRASMRQLKRLKALKAGNGRSGPQQMPPTSHLRRTIPTINPIISWENIMSQILRRPAVGTPLVRMIVNGRCVRRRWL